MPANNCLHSAVMVLYFTTTLTGKDDVAINQTPKITDLKQAGNFCRTATPCHLTIRNWQFRRFLK